jgi:hypothetical protein
MIEIKLLNRLLEKYKFANSLPVEIQRFAAESRVRILKSSLKAVGDYSVFYGLVIKIYFRARKYGFRPSLALSKAMIIFASALLTVAAAAGAVYISGILSVQHPATDAQTQQHQVIDETAEKKIAIQEIDKPRPDSIIRYKYGITDFTAKNADEDVARKAADIVAGEFIKINGAKNAIKIGIKNARAEYIVSGSIGKIGNRFIVSIKIVDSKMRVVSGSTGRADSAEEALEVCRGIAGKMAGGR